MSLLLLLLVLFQQFLFLNGDLLLFLRNGVFLHLPIDSLITAVLMLEQNVIRDRPTIEVLMVLAENLQVFQQLRRISGQVCDHRVYLPARKAAVVLKQSVRYAQLTKVPLTALASLRLVHHFIAYNTGCTVLELRSPFSWWEPLPGDVELRLSSSDIF